MRDIKVSVAKRSQSFLTFIIVNTKNLKDLHGIGIILHSKSNIPLHSKNRDVNVYSDQK